VKIAHALKFYPKTSGLYETAREIIEEEIAQGYDARIFDVRENVKPSKYLYDRGARSCSLEWFKKADVCVMHQMMPKEFLDNIDRPIVTVLHGTPEACYMSDIWEESNSMSLIMDLIKSYPQMTFVTLWERHFHFWNNLAPGRVVYIPSCVNLSRFHPDKVEPIKFLNSGGTPNILFADTWRIIKDPFHIVHAYKLFKDRYPKARLHIYCKPSNPRDPSRKFFDKFLFDMAEGRKDFYGFYEGYVLEIDKAMAGADFVVTGQMDDTRIYRESLSLGTPVVRPNSTCDLLSPKDFADKMSQTWEQITRKDINFCKENIRQLAETKFNPTNTVNLLVDHFNNQLSLV
jgi:glycosyltransferase involved in cell wall biosynthesis